MSKKIMNSEKSDLKAMYDRLANSPVIIDDEKFHVTDDDIDKYNEKHDSDLNLLLLHVDTLFDTNDTDRESNVKEFLDSLLDKIKLADDNETKQINIYKSLSTDKIKNISRKLGLEENIEKTETLLQSKQHECREIRDNTKKKVEELKTERDIEKMKTEDARVKYFNQTLSLHDGLQEEDNNLNAKIIDNDEIQIKYKDFEDSIQSRQECFSNQIRHREIEIQLLRARLEQEQQFEEQNNRRKEAYDKSIEQHMNSEKERLEKIELYKTYLSSSSTSPEQSMTNIREQFHLRKVEIKEAISKLEIVNKLLRDKHNDTKSQLINATNSREQLLEKFKTLKEKCEEVEKNCRAIKDKRAKLIAK